MLAALAGVVHDCQRADDHEHNRATRTIIKGVFMVTSRPRPLTEPNFRGSKMNSG
jgi:hypothetical protein